MNLLATFYKTFKNMFNFFLTDKGTFKTLREFKIPQDCKHNGENIKS